MKGARMRIRMAQEKDIPRIDDLLLQVCLVHHIGRPDLFKKDARKYTDAQLTRLLADATRPIFVAVDDDDVTQGYAFCISQEHPNDNVLTDIRTLYIDDLCVDESLRGRHVGRQLYDHVLAFARENSYYNVTLNVWSCNERAQRFYESCGLTPQKTCMEQIL